MRLISKTGTGNRKSGTGNRKSGTGNRQAAFAAYSAEAAASAAKAGKATAARQATAVPGFEFRPFDFRGQFSPAATIIPWLKKSGGRFAALEASGRPWRLVSARGRT